MRRLIINADDFGLTTGVNRAIAEAQQHGIVTSATLMANSRAFDEAAGLARSLTARGRNFSVGCHVVLMDGAPLLPPEQVPSLLQPGSNNGRFRSKLNDFVVASFRGKLQPTEIEAEATAQIRKLQTAGISPSHFDTHKHAHMFPAVLRPLLRAAQACGVPAVRNPFGQVWPLPFGDMVRKRHLWTRFAQLNVLRNFSGQFRREVQAHGMHTTDGSVAVLVTGSLDLKLFGKIMDRLPEGAWEFVCHPGYNDAELTKVQTRLRQSREQELALLISPEARDVLDRHGIELISYRQL
ncbi:MAG: ChbG/HpnK family deacetylase [Acidobacteriota bacterium]|nr:ChbG/HpnK family deacetylase [Acidobacteriota bacterium]